MKTIVTSMMQFILLTSLILSVGVFSGCNSMPWSAKAERPVMTAHYTAVPVKVDGILDDAAWANAAVYTLDLSADNLVKGQTLNEPGEVRLAWDDHFFYVGIKYHDSDLVAENDQNQAHHYKYGDVAELFLKPVNSTWYWELYATPRGNKTSLFFPGRGYLGLESCDKYTCDLQTAAQCQGTLNNWHDRDQYWTAEFAMPIKDLNALGDTFAPGQAWRILVARYNYNRYLSNTELSMTPSLTATNYHLNEDYATLQLLKP